MSEWRFFSDLELSCSHCGALRMQSDFMGKLVALRKACRDPYQALLNAGYGEAMLHRLGIRPGYPEIKFPVTSGYRCEEHPVEKQKTRPGTHAKGRAVDIAIRGTDAWIVLALSSKFGMSGIGVSQKGTARFLHLDDDTEGYRPTTWSY